MKPKLTSKLLLVVLFLTPSFNHPLAGPVCTASPESLSVQEGDQIKALAESAATCVRQGRLDDAVVVYGKLISKDPANNDAFLNRGTIYAQKGEVSAALDDFDHVIKSSPSTADAWYGRGLVYLRANRLDDGIADLTEAIKLKPDFAVAYCSLGMDGGGRGDADRVVGARDGEMEVGGRVPEAEIGEQALDLRL